MALRNYRDLKVWQRAIDLTDTVYAMTRSFPPEERYGISAQMRRSAVSIPSNIAEGAARESTKDYLRHLSIAFGSLAELETQTIVSNRQHYLSDEQFNAFDNAAAELGRMLRGLHTSLKRRL